MTNNAHSIEGMKLSAIKPRDSRWRIYPTGQIDETGRQLARAAQVVEPPLLDSDNRVVCGGALVQAAINRPP